MPTDTAIGPASAISFAARLAAWGLGLFGLLRLAPVERVLVVPLTAWQGQAARALAGAPALAVDVTLACSGVDAVALCAAAILAYPAPWRRRIAGAAGGTAAIVALNIVRIASLTRAAAEPRWFELLHLYIWPVLLTLAIAAYVFAWMGLADSPGRVAPARVGPRRSSYSRRFVLWTGALLVIFTAAAPLYLESATVLWMAAFVARAAAALLSVVRVEASAAGNVLTTTRGAFLVTQECIATPLIPLYLAAVLAGTAGWRRVAGVAAAIPLFIGLGIARLLVVAIPAVVVASPLFLVHAFYQLLLGAALVVIAAAWRHGTSMAAWRRAAIGTLLGCAAVWLLLPAARGAIAWTFRQGPPLDDPQGAIALLPAFQCGLFLALSVAVFSVARWRPAIAGVFLLVVSQAGLLALLHFLVMHAGWTPHVRDVRGWAVAAPLLLVAGMVTRDRAAL